jgi:hypothetical protein
MNIGREPQVEALQRHIHAGINAMLVLHGPPPKEPKIKLWEYEARVIGTFWVFLTGGLTADQVRMACRLVMLCVYSCIHIQGSR